HGGDCHCCAFSIVQVQARSGQREGLRAHTCRQRKERQNHAAANGRQHEMLSMTSPIVFAGPHGMSPGWTSEPAILALLNTHPQNPCRWVGPGNSWPNLTVVETGPTPVHENTSAVATSWSRQPASAAANSGVRLCWSKTSAN